MEKILSVEQPKPAELLDEEDADLKLQSLKEK